MEEQIIRHGILTHNDRNRMSDEINSEIADAFHFAKNSPFPDDVDWTVLNYGMTTPLADSLLEEGTMAEFNEDQLEAVPGPY